MSLRQPPHPSSLLRWLALPLAWIIFYFNSRNSDTFTSKYSKAERSRSQTLKLYSVACTMVHYMTLDIWFNHTKARFTYPQIGIIFHKIHKLFRLQCYLPKFVIILAQAYTQILTITIITKNMTAFFFYFFNVSY